MQVVERPSKNGVSFNNPGNFIVVNRDGYEPDIICMDYGRCLHWGESNTYLSKKDFEPFEINIKALKEELNEIKTKTADLSWFTDVCIDKLFERLEKNRELWIDVSN